jgi:UDP-glucose 4-epimerase
VKILVTGGAGFIGSHLVDALIQVGHEVTVVDDLSTGEVANLNPGAAFEEMDIRSPQCSELVKGARFEAIFHQAAQMSVSRSVREPLFDVSVNVMGTLNLLEAIRGSGCRFFFASTGGALYGDSEVLPTPESAPAWPVSAYGSSKLAVEHYLHFYGFVDDLKYAALRYANVYGPRQNPHGEAGVVAIFCRAMFSGGQPVINGAGTQTRDYIHVSDVVAANLAALDSGACGHFNIGTSRQTTVNEIFEIIADRAATGTAKSHGPARAGEQLTSALDYRLAREKLGWEPTMDLEAGLTGTVEWFREDVIRSGSAGK